MTTPNLDFRNIRQWRGSQHQAFEELCYQLRDPTPTGAELVKTGNPDSGLQRVDKLSAVPGNRALSYFFGSVRECFSELNTIGNTFGVWDRRLDTVVRPWATDPFA